LIERPGFYKTGVLRATMAKGEDNIFERKFNGEESKITISNGLIRIAKWPRILKS